jgi:hypothetical protein
MRTERFKKSFFPSAITAWNYNDLDQDLRNIKTRCLTLKLPYVICIVDKNIT